MIDLQRDLTTILKKKGASIVGFADLSGLDPEGRKGFGYGLSIGVALNSDVVLELGNGPTMDYYNEYNRINILLDELAELAAARIMESGFMAFPMTRENVVEDEKTWRTSLPYKTVATRAGIGWIGKNAMLVNEKYGSALRLTAVLTDAELVTGRPYSSSQCGSCEICKEVCPTKAISGESWTKDTDRDDLFNAFDCRKTARERTSKIGVKASLCGLCFYACPWTKRYLKRV